MKARLVVLLVVALVLVVARAVTKPASSRTSLVLGNAFASILGGILGCWLGFEYLRGKDAIFPIAPIIGLVLGVFAGPIVYSSVWRARSDQRDE